MENKTYKLKFKTFDFDEDQANLNDIADHYTSELSDYFKKLELENAVIDIKVFDKEKYSEEERIISTTYLLSHNPTLKVSLYANKKERSKQSWGSFYMYSQNNCCGAMSVSSTNVPHSIHNKKLATIFQYIKEDIAINQKVGILTCTDIVYEGYDYAFKKKEDELKLSILKPYRANHKILLKNGWKESKLFYNVKSNNVVGLFTKDILDTYNDRVPKTVELNVFLDGVLNKVENIMIGGDPEVFLFDKKKQEYVPSFNYIEGEKGNPTSISTKGHAIQIDNCSLEYNFPPCKTAEEFIHNNLFVQEYIKSKICEPNGLELRYDAYAVFKKKYLKDSRALTFGCDVDYNAWKDGKANEVGNTTGTGRSGGGHLHISYDNHNTKTSLSLVKLLDYFISVPLVIMEPENLRKTMYGKAGSYRLTKFGLEYRSPSNFIYSSKEMMQWTFDRVNQAIEYYNRSEFYRKNGYLSDVQYNIVDCISSGQKAVAEDVCKKLKIPLLNINTKEVCVA